MNLTSVTTVDYHTGGEPFRIVTEPPVALGGVDVADRRARAQVDDDAQWLRRVLCHEPRGHADMYGGFVVPPDDDGARFGVLFWHADGFSAACGHGTIALGAWAVDEGLVEAPDDGVCPVVIDVPSGRVTASVHRSGGRTIAVDFVNVAGYVLDRNLEVDTPMGPVSADLAFGGAIYAQVDVAQLGLTVSPDHLPALITLGRSIKAAVNASGAAVHPSDTRLDGVYGTIFHEDLAPDRPPTADLHQRNVTVFADGQVDRSPCGSGTASRLAVLADDGLLDGDRRLVHDSIVGSRFVASVIEETEVDGRRAVVPLVSGTAHRTGEHRFVVDPADPITPGFILR